MTYVVKYKFTMTSALKLFPENFLLLEVRYFFLQQIIKSRIFIVRYKKTFFLRFFKKFLKLNYDRIYLYDGGDS